MRIDTNTWHYNLWAKTYLTFHHPVPTSSNLCSYVRRLLLVPPVIALGWVMMRFLAACHLITYYLCIAPVLFCIGHIPLRPAQVVSCYGTHRRYAGLHVGGSELYPWHVLALVCFGALEWCMWHRNLEATAVAHGIVCMMLGVPIALIAVLVTSTNAIVRYQAKRRAHPCPPKQPNQTLLLVKEWWQAKKAGVCPLIEFNDATSQEGQGGHDDQQMG